MLMSKELLISHYTTVCCQYQVFSVIKFQKSFFILFLQGKKEIR